MNPNIYDLLAMQNQAPQGPQMLQGVPQGAAMYPQPQLLAGVDQNAMLNPNSQGTTPKKNPFNLMPDTGSAPQAASAPAAKTPSLMELFQKKALEGNASTQASIKSIEDQANTIRNAPHPTDYSALMGLTDAWTGSNFGKTYQKPTTDAERAQKLLDLQTQLLGAKDKLSDNDLNVLKAQMTDNRDQQKMNHETQQEKLKLQQIQAMAGNSANKMSTADEHDLTKWTDKVMNPSTRLKLGGYQKRIDSATGIQTLANTYSGGLPADASADAKAKAYDNMTVPQVEEVTKSLDNMLSGGSSTISGADHLRFQTLQSKLAQAKAYLGNSPQPAKLGAFVQQAMDTVDREKKLYTGMQKDTHTGLKMGSPGLYSRNKEAMDNVLELASKNGGDMSAPAAQDAGPSQVDVEAELRRRGLLK